MSLVPYMLIESIDANIMLRSPYRMLCIETRAVHYWEAAADVS
jgi:hypothetical protein